MIGLILVGFGILIVEKSANSMTRLPISIVPVTLTTQKVNRDCSGSMTNEAIIMSRWRAIKKTKHNSPNINRLTRILKFVLDVMAIVGKKIRKSSWATPESGKFVHSFMILTYNPSGDG